MKYKANSRRRALEYEKDLIEKWKNNKTFEKSIAIRDESNSYVFYDGPPFITGSPHVGTLLSSIVKDAVPRYQTMRGKRVERVWGWDCHGLPAENFVEKKLGINSRQEIGTKVSLEDYIVSARESMVQTSGLWEGTIESVGGSTLRAATKPWTKITWNLFGGPLRLYTKKAKSMRASAF